MARIVMKFGGTSMAGTERIRRVAQLVKRQAERGDEVAVVVSAMAGDTDRLVNFCREANALYDPAEYDVVVAAGEQITAGLLAITLQALGCEARSWLGWQMPIHTDGAHAKARIGSIDTDDLLASMQAGNIAVIPGFQGLTDDNRITTLGRGGSDTSAVAVAAAAGEAMAQRRQEDERYALFAEAAVVFLDLPDAVFRGYEGDEQLLGSVRDNDAAPIDLLRKEIARLEPQRVYFPLGIGSHVDHQLCRRVGAALLGDAQAWTMPGIDWSDKVAFYEDFPYAYWQQFDPSAGLPANYTAGLPAGIRLAPEIADITDVLEQKVQGIAQYESQVPHLFGSVEKMADAVRTQGATVALQSGRGGAVERYWSAVRS